MSTLTPMPQHCRAIANWLLVCAALVAFMVFVGGVTRLTESGLSIVEWKLFSGTLPPLTEEAWLAEFEEYKATPQFKQVNQHFELSDFKGIYWLEYLHRLLGRIIGLAVLLPFLYFSARRMLPRRLFFRCFGIGLLVAAQGTVGWVMVSSGLVDQPRVAPIKLGAHLLLAFTVFCVILWTRWQVLGHAVVPASRLVRRLALFTLTLVILQIFMGALVAGLRAGLTYNSYPLMDGQFIPGGLHALMPHWLNHFENVTMVQFQHRMGAIAVVVSGLILAAVGWKNQALRTLSNQIALTLSLQFVLGVATLLSVVQIGLASAHQLAALLLLALLVRFLYQIRA